MWAVVCSWLNSVGHSYYIFIVWWLFVLSFSVCFGCVGGLLFSFGCLLLVLVVL